MDHLLPWLGQSLTEFFGPFRLFTSYLFLAGFGTALVALITGWLLPRFWCHLPTDRGRAFAIEAERSLGKPVGGGLIFISIYLLGCLLIVPFDWPYLAALGCLLLAMLIGFLDDRTPGGWGEVRLGVLDLGISLLGAMIICRFQPVTVWLPLLKAPLVLPPLLYLPLATVLIWLTINATNCTDGVDGLSGSLTALAFGSLGGILYGVVGHQEIARYLLVPHYQAGANWGLLAFLMVGCLAGYLWHNGYPSAVLMGDAGSRPLGFLLGMLVLASGNPFLVMVVAGVVLVNGGTGLVKVALLRYLRIKILKQVRCPLHDHVRYKNGWSNTQVVMRFMLFQAVGTPILFILLLKIR